MAEETTPPPPAEGKVPEPQGHFAARVPERVARGVYTSAQVLIEAPKEIMIDFLMGLTRPFNVVSRVIVTPQTLAEFINALERNLENYVQQFGQPPNPPIPPNQKTPTLEEIYENFKLSDDMLSGAYANSVLIGHSATEFVLDFITTFYPHSAVASRVYISSAQAPRFLNTLKSSMQRYQQRFGKKEENP